MSGGRAADLPWVRAGEFSLIAATLGLVTGLVQLALISVKQYGLGVAHFADPRFVWKGPLSYALVFVAVGALLWPMHRLRPRLLPLGLVVGMLVFGGAYSALRVFSVQLHATGLLLLSTGFALRAGTWAGRGNPGFLSLAKRTMPIAAGLVATLGLGYEAVRFTGDRAAHRALPAPPPDAVNVLLLILDTGRALSMSVYGNPRPTTPHLEALAESGVVFERATATSSWSQPSHASLFTGRWPHEIATEWRSFVHLPSPTLAEAFRDRGYRTGGFVANTRYLSRNIGLAKGFAYYEDYRTLSLGSILSTTWLARQLGYSGLVGRYLYPDGDVLGRKHAPDVIYPFLEWASREDGRPFFAMLNLFDAHQPYRPPQPHRDRFANSNEGASAAEAGAGPADPELRTTGQQLAREAYEGTLAYLDEQVGSLFVELDRRGLLENTVIVLTSDHGEEFGSVPQRREHGASLHWPAIHVPLMIWARGRVPAGLRVGEPVSLRSVAATIAELAGLSDSAFPGTSLTRHWTSRGVGAGDAALSRIWSGGAAGMGVRTRSLGNLTSLVSGNLHYIRSSDGRAHLYDYVKDPFELLDIAGRVPAETLAAFRERVEDYP